jgi:hypothetical protein
MKRKDEYKTFVFEERALDAQIIFRRYQSWVTLWRLN